MNEKITNDIPGLQEVLTRLVAAFRPTRVILFGSRAKGMARADSDLDLLLVADSDEPIHVRMARAQRALRGLTIPVDVFVATPEEVERFGGWISHTISIALREGREVYAA